MKQLLSHFNFVKRYTFLTVIIGVCLLAIGLRFFQYAQFPNFGETQDEFAWTFLGSSLIQKGEPTSWSYFGAYPERKHVELHGESYWFVTPALDHPPLFSLIPGLAATLQGTYWQDFPSIKAARFPVIILGSANAFLFAWWLYRTLGKSVATILGTIIFATAPSFIFLSRLVVSENLLLTWLLLILLMSTFSAVPRWLVIVVHAALPLTKISGLAIGVGSVVALFQRKKEWKSALVGVVAGIIVLCAYAAFFDWEIFLAVQLQQSQRDAGLLTVFLTQLWSNVLIAKPFSDIWITLGWWAAIGALFLKKAPKGWKDPQSWSTWQYIFLAELAFLALSVGEHTVHGWYKIVFLPFFALSLGLAAQWVYRQMHWLGLAGITVLFAAQARAALFYLWGPIFFEFQSTLNKVWFGLAGLFALPSLFRWNKIREMHLWQASWVVFVMIVIVCNCAVVAGITYEKYSKDELYLIEGIRP